MDLMRSLPLGLYLEQPVTWLHQLDSRVKFAWLMTFLFAPIQASPLWRLGLVVVLILITWAAAIPWRVWRQQMGWLLMFCLLLFVLSALAPDGIAVSHQPRLPSDELTFPQQSTTLPQPSQRHPWYNPFAWGKKDSSFQGKNTGDKTLQNQVAPNLPQPTDYSYVLFQQGPLRVTRRSFVLGLSVSTLYFTLIYSTNLFLLTTAPEEITAGLENLMQPLRYLRLPVTEISLTLTLSLRFIPLVLEEVQNLTRSVSTRAINWKKLGFKGSMQVWLIVAQRLLENLLLRAEQMASAMLVRGFTSPNEHRVQWNVLQLKSSDWLALGIMVVFWVGRLVWGWEA
ncbi:MAG: CbiQ family ECF transporter T component [Oscillatoriaceae bacterium SKW80]|nr:CbiQ family ECF transporter T component [Oscillatoriaceae bacterium SKYG93]MCX8121661.1 CbiQ family ECF transporter T component [Oscillatoriaceae bacterium SKW80]MDW8453969.1 CbiQ family ECF transporter T component [Oscillatoriaceae cyanobacterium SKYGB_i_bin93]HIK28786.1 energy-coupling factor transporter transmembrane protein EcfT [Oscillatoriaceae cyanobacterium M7585_C2015_266]